MDYKSSGVDINKADSLISDVRHFASLSYQNGVLGGVGGFGALFEIKKYKNPVLVSSTDGVGTKILLAHSMKKFSGLGYDLVAMSVDDVICCGAKPLFFLDYIAVGRLEKPIYLTLIESITKACSYSGCSLIGGETAELPGMYPGDEFDLAGFCVGVMEKKDIIKPESIKEGDAVIGLASSGFHSNGFSLIRKVIEIKNLDLNNNYGFGILGNILLSPTEIYTPVILKARSAYKKALKGIAHITGGGIEGNLNRVLPGGLDAVLNKKSWKIPEVIQFILNQGEIEENEAFKTFNMGIGMALVVDRAKKDEILGFFNKNSYKSYEIGKIEKGSGIVRFN
ncbi:MAG: phosphoribosylformylglycinamidine cyclo-ligase [Brevinematales bacterium]|jgi:phosphoribosylformylglycinamidine cyclo-ligase